MLKDFDQTCFVTTSITVIVVLLSAAKKAAKGCLWCKLSILPPIITHLLSVVLPQLYDCTPGASSITNGAISTLKFC